MDDPNQSSTTTRTDTSLAKTDTRVLRVRLYALPATTSVFVALYDDLTGALLHSATLTTTRPGVATFLAPQMQVRNSTTTTSAMVDVLRWISACPPY